MANEKNMTAQRTSFWELICTTEVQIPNYQREYAQGRNNTRAELIRDGFVESLYNSLDKNEPLELDFIFGGMDTGDDGDAFNPVDGQQRLTILFLLHWYIFVRAGKTIELKKMGEKFCYKTRTTSKTFCKKICNEDLELQLELNEKGNYSISLQIVDRPWFTGAMNSDPTVKSMLVVIDCIHKRFSENSDMDYEQISELLISDKCPITFFCLNLNKALGITSGIRDLYIKMNARGLALTDFELFKANLQKKDDSGDRLDLLTEYFKKTGKKDDDTERIELIGKFNNEYTNFFFNLVDNGEIKLSNNDGSQGQMFDISMMNFINEVFRMNYFSAVSELGAGQKDYRSYNDVFRKMSGREFISFIEKKGKYYNEKIWDRKQKPANADKVIKNAIVNAFDNIIKLMDMFSEAGVKFVTEQVDNTNGSCQYLLGEILKKYAEDPQNNGALPFRESLIRMGLFEFILKFGVPNNDAQKDAFNTWSRFVWKIDKNSEFKNFDEAIETLKGYKVIIDDIPKDEYTSDSVMKAIAKIDVSEESGKSKKVVAGPARMQLVEEIAKAKLILADSRWREEIKEAEDYYNDCGQIWFLLDLSKLDFSEINGQRELERFDKAFKLSKKLFAMVEVPQRGKVRYIRNVNVNSNDFERALLALPEFDKEDHLDSMGKSTGQTKKFVGEDFSRHVSHQYCESNNDREKTKYIITMTLLQKMVDEPEILDVDMRKWLQDYFRCGKSSVDWKNVFIQNDLIDETIGGLSFKNTFEPDAWGENSYTAVYTNVARRTDSGELHSFLMASRLSSDERVRVWYHTCSDEEYITEGFPNRYFEVYSSDDNVKFEIGYMQGEFYSRIDGKINKIGNEKDVDRFVSEHVN